MIVHAPYKARASNQKQNEVLISGEMMSLPTTKEQIKANKNV